MDFQIEAYLNFRRYERNKLLDDSDKYLLPDYPITSNNLELVKQYRQQLRDYMDLEGVKNYNFNSIDPIPDFPQFPILE
jgi:hypothetical protein